MLGVTGFGGVLPLMHRALVEKKRWLSDTRFAELLGLCQFLPGGNAVNLCVATGVEFHGIKGGFVSLAGLITAPLLVIVCLGNIWSRWHDNPVVASVFAGISAVAAGMIIATGLKLLIAMPRTVISWLIMGGIIIAIAVLRLPLLPVLLVAVPLTLFVMYRKHK
jgi:chromate transporter